MPSGHRAGSIYDTNGISPTVMDNHGYPAFILEKNNMCDDETAIPIFLGNCLNPKFTGCSYAGALWDAEGISPTLNTMQGGNRQPFVLISEKTMNSRLVDMLERGLIPNEDAVWKTLTTRLSRPASLERFVQQSIVQICTMSQR